MHEFIRPRLPEEEGAIEPVVIGPTRLERRAGRSTFRSGNRADLSARVLRRIRKADRTRQKVAA